jgi:FKBP-type peptidyl-prolyl cis-trans isomerase SlyD
MKIAGVIGLTLALALGVAGAQEKENEKAVSPAIENGAKVQLEYTLKDDGGKVLDSNKGHDPLTYTQGQKQIIPGLEQALSGMHAGDDRRIVRIKEVKEKTVVIDLNHPLAGKTLFFDVKVLGVEPPKK